MRRISLLACGSLLLGGLVLGACGGDDDDNGGGSGGGDTGGTGGGTGGKGSGGNDATGGNDGSGGKASGGSGTGGGAGEGGMSGLVPEDRFNCEDIAPLGMGGSGTFSISSPDFDDCDPIPTSASCDGKAFGEGDSPELSWTEGPEGTMSYAIVFKDLSIVETFKDSDDAMAYGRAFHWVIWDIPADVLDLPGGLGGGHFPDEVPGSRQWGVNEYAYLGPCPNPFAETEVLFNDSYSFTIYAMEEETLGDLPAATLGNWVPDMDAYLEANALAVAEYRTTSDAWATSFTPPSIPLPPCTEDQDEGDDDCVDGEP